MEHAELYARSLRGHEDGLAETAARLTTADDLESRAWGLALCASRSAMAPERAAPPSLAEVAPLVRDPRAARVALLACAQSARRALVELDAEAHARWLALGAELTAAAGGAEPSFELERCLGALEGGAAPDEDDLAALRSAAMDRGDASTVVGVAVAQAFAAELRGAPEEALAAARRASRMARTEAIPQQEYLANVFLARCRRLVGHPHLAARILSGLLRVASAQWRGWFAWELLLAGSRTGAAAALSSAPEGQRAAEATRAAMSLLDRAEEGDHARFDARVAELLDRCCVSPRLRADAEGLVSALDARRPVELAPAAFSGWLRGDEIKPPRGLHGLAADAGSADSIKSAVVYVAADPDGGARRLLAPGVALLRDRYAVMTQSQRRQGRLDTALAVLALAGPEGLRVEELFLRVYEFDYDPEIHQGALRKLLARVEEWLGDAGAIDAIDERRRLRVGRPILVADPRSVPAVDVRVLGVLAERGATSAREAAKRLRIPLRTAQAALQDLLEDGTCRRVRSGNRVEYRIEDTTFSEPTQH